MAIILPQQQSIGGGLGQGLGQGFSQAIQMMVMNKIQQNQLQKERAYQTETEVKKRELMLKDREANRAWALQTDPRFKEVPTTPVAGPPTRAGVSPVQAPPGSIQAGGRAFTRAAPQKVVVDGRYLGDMINGKFVRKTKEIPLKPIASNIKTFLTPQERVVNIDLNQGQLPPPGSIPISQAPGYKKVAKAGMTAVEERARLKRRSDLEMDIASGQLQPEGTKIALNEYHTLLPDNATEVYIHTPEVVKGFGEGRFGLGRNVPPSTNKVKLPKQGNVQLTMEDVRFSAKKRKMTIEEVLNELYGVQ